jgi:hypothetical protein
MIFIMKSGVQLSLVERSPRRQVAAPRFGMREVSVRDIHHEVRGVA